MSSCGRQCRNAKFNTHFIKCTITGISSHLEALIEAHVTSFCRAAKQTHHNSEKESWKCASPLTGVFKENHYYWHAVWKQIKK
jgi:hypothetical protein